MVYRHTSQCVLTRCRVGGGGGIASGVRVQDARAGGGAKALAGNAGLMGLGSDITCDGSGCSVRNTTRGAD